MRAALSLLVAFPALAVARNVVTIGMTGGWHEDKPTDKNTKLLGDALSGSSFGKAVDDTRVCFSEVTTVETQVVAGTNYRFHISGCVVMDSDGECSDSTLSACKPTEFVVQIFEQPWTSTLKVTRITEVEPSNGRDSGKGDEQQDEQQTETTQTSEVLVTKLKAAKLSEDEKKAVDAWINANGLNKYGDESTRMYVGGTPLFDENKGTTTDRYDYILSRHSDRPWQMETQTANFLALEEADTRGGGSVAGVFAMLGVFTVVLAGVAVIKMHQGRRDRVRYKPIRTREQ